NDKDYPSYEGLSAILKSTNLTNVKKLTLNNCQFDDRCCNLLAQSPRVQTITHLDLSHNVIGDGGLLAILESSNFRHLVCIDLRKNSISKKTIRRLKTQVPE